MMTDAQSNEGRLQEAQALVQRYLQTIVKKDIEGWMNLWDDNFVLEFPYAPQGRPRQIEDKATLYPYIQNVIKDLEIVSIAQPQIYLTQYPDLIIAEITGEGRLLSTGRAYRTNYVWMMRTRDGKLIHMRDYWNPLALMEARSSSSNGASRA